jgi:hypothetical protein
LSERVEPSLRLYVLAGLFDRPLRGGGHILDPQILGNDQAVLGDELRRLLVNVVFAPVGDLAVAFGEAA